MATRYGVRGSLQLSRAFRDIANSPTAAARRKARAAALAPIRDAAKQNLIANGSVETGALAASLSIAHDGAKGRRTLMGPRTGTVKGRVPSAYSHLVEYGTAPHWQPNRFGGIMHPGARPKPWLRPALDSSTEAAAKAYFTLIAAEIEAAARRVAARSAGRR